MPELPECESARRLLEAHVVGHTIAYARLKEQGGGPRDGLYDEKVFSGLEESVVLGALVGATVLAAKRKGKQLWLSLSTGRSLLVHHGMTGALVVKGVKAPRYKTFEVDSQWPPKFCKLELEFAKGSVAFSDPRRFGRLSLAGDQPEDEEPLCLLAADALAVPSLEDCISILAATRTVKAVLLDQRTLVSGIGNWVADEVCYQAGIHPGTQARALGRGHVETLREKISYVCSVATESNADDKKFPKEWLFHHRWAKQTTGTLQTPIGRLHFDTIGGRTTAFLPDKQPKLLFSSSKSSSSATKDTDAADTDGSVAKKAVSKRKRK